MLQVNKQTIKESTMNFFPVTTRSARPPPPPAMEFFHGHRFSRGFEDPPTITETERTSSPVSAVEYGIYVDHETNRRRVLRCIEEEQELLKKESTASKARFKANLYKVHKELERNKAKLNRIERDYQRSQNIQNKIGSKLHALEEEHEIQEEMLQCQVMNLKLFRDYFMKDKDWKERVCITNGDMSSLSSLDNLFRGKEGVHMDKKDIINVKKQLDHVKYLCVGYQTAHRRAKDENALQRAVNMKIKAMEEFNRLNGISIEDQMKEEILD